MRSPHASRHARAWLGLLVSAPLAVVGQEEKEAPRDLGPALVAAGEDLTDAGRAFVELTTPRDTLVLGEPFELHLVFGIEREFLRANLVQLFQQSLDVPVQLFAPAFVALEGARFLPADEPSGGARVALDEAIVRATPLAERTLDGRTYAVYELVRRAVATRAGALELPAPALAFAYATRFADDFVQGRLPVDRRAARVRGRAARLTILPLPEADRPPEFTGAIGRVTLAATATPQELEAGQGLELVLAIAAADELADLSNCEPPRLDGLAGFHLRGSVVEREPARVTARYDLVPDGPEVREVPPIAFATYDLTPPAGYRTTTSAAIPLRVRARPAAPARESATPAAPAPEPAPPIGQVVFALLVLALLLGLWLFLRARART